MEDKMNWERFLSPLDERFAVNQLHEKISVPPNTKRGTLIVDRCLGYLEKDHKDVSEQKEIQLDHLKQETRRLLKPMKRNVDMFTFKSTERVPSACHDAISPEKFTLVKDKDEVQDFRNFKTNDRNRTKFSTEKVVKNEAVDSSSNIPSADKSATTFRRILKFDNTGESHGGAGISKDQSANVQPGSPKVACDELANETLVAEVDLTISPSPPEKKSSAASTFDADFMTEGDALCVNACEKLDDVIEMDSNEKDPIVLGDTPLKKPRLEDDLQTTSSSSSQAGSLEHDQLAKLQRSEQDVLARKSIAQKSASLWEVLDLSVVIQPDMLEILDQVAKEISAKASLEESLFENMKNSLILASKTYLPKELMFSEGKLCVDKLYYYLERHSALNRPVKAHVRETDIRVLLDPIFAHLCPQFDLRVKTEYKFPRSDNLSGGEADYVITYKDTPVAVVETKTPQAFKSKSFAQLIALMLNVQNEHQNSDVQTLGVLTDGWRWVFVVLDSKVFKVEGCNNTRLFSNGRFLDTNYKVIRVRKCNNWDDLYDVLNIFRFLVTQSLNIVKSVLRNHGIQQYFSLQSEDDDVIIPESQQSNDSDVIVLDKF